MLGTTLWLVVVIGLMATLLMDAAASFGRAGVHAAADHAVESGLRDAVSDYQNALQNAMANDPGAGPPAGFAVSRTIAADASATSADLGLRTTYAVVPTTLTAPACASPAPASGADTIAWLQCSGLVRESRMSLHVTVGVLDPTGSQLLAQREEYVTLRLFAEPPFSAVVGSKDGAAARLAGGPSSLSPAHEGDIGGDTLSGASPPPRTALPPAGGTLIHLRYECHDGSGSCANAAPPDPDADLQPNVTWTNGNQPSP